MAGQRVKYTEHKFKEGCKISVREYVSQSTGARYRSILDLGKMQYYIRNERTKTYVFVSDKIGNMNVLKRKARAELERFGVNLKKEIRDRQFGICPRGYSQEQHEKEND
jgi:hypothetical protein